MCTPPILSGSRPVKRPNMLMPPVPLSSTTTVPIAFMPGTYLNRVCKSGVVKLLLCVCHFIQILKLSMRYKYSSHILDENLYMDIERFRFGFHPGYAARVATQLFCVGFLVGCGVGLDVGLAVGRRLGLFFLVRGCWLGHLFSNALSATARHTAKNAK